MALTPGLRPHREDRPEGGKRLRGRVMVDEPRLDAPKLTPRAAPVDFYHRPARPPIDNNAEMLVQALGSLSPALARLGATFKETGEDKQARAAAAESDMARLTDDQLKEGIRTGQIDMSDKYKAGVAGERLAFNRIRAIEKAYAEAPDKSKFDLDKAFADAAAEDLGSLGQDAIGHKPYLSVMTRARATFMEKHGQVITQETVAENQQGVFERMVGVYETLKRENKSGADIATAVRSMYDDNKLGLKVSYKEQDKELMRLAQLAASKGDVATVEALLNTDRVAADGTKLGKLSENREHVAAARQALERAQAEQRQANAQGQLEAKVAYQEKARNGQLDQKALVEEAKANPGRFSDEYVQSLVNLNNAAVAGHKEAIQKLSEKAENQRRADDSRNEALVNGLRIADQGLLSLTRDAQVVDESGNVKTVPAEKRIKDVTQRFLDDQDKLVQSKQLTPEQSFTNQATWFANNGVEHPRWKTELASGAMTPSAALLGKEGKPPVNLQKGFELYRQLKEKAPALLNRHLSKTDEQFYEGLRVLTERGGQTLEQAYPYALKLIQNGTDADNELTANVYKQVEAKIDDPGNTHWGDSGARNNRQVRRDLLQMSKLYIRAGLNENDAIAEAEKRFVAANENVNGWWVPTNRKEIPVPDGTGSYRAVPFKQLAENALKTWAKDGDTPKWLQAAGIPADRVSLMPEANGNYVLIDTKTSLPITHSKHGAVRVSLEKMIEMEANRLQQERAKATGEVIHGSTLYNDLSKQNFSIRNRYPFLGNQQPKR